MKDENSETLENLNESLVKNVKKLEKVVNKLQKQIKCTSDWDSFKSLDKEVQIEFIKAIPRAKKPKCCTGKSFVFGFLLGLVLVIFLSVIVMCCCCKADCICSILC